MKKLTFGAAALALAFTTGAANAAVINVTTDLSAPFISGAAMAGSAQTGAEMAGMNVTAMFADGSSRSAVWGTTGPVAGSAVSAGNFSLSQSRNTYSFNWTLENLYGSALTGLRINGLPGGTVFDAVASPVLTFDSRGGRAYEDRSALAGAIAVTYARPVGVSGNAPLNDVFGEMLLDYTGLASGGLGSGQSLQFRSDTDTVVPVPGALPLALTGLAGMAWLGYRRKA